MPIANYNNPTRRVVGLLSIGLLLRSGCKRSSTAPAANTKALLPGVSQPVRVSSGDADAAEPAIAGSPDGSVYVAWVNHGPKTQADVMLARFTGDGQMQDPAVRVNSAAGVATAWRSLRWRSRIQSEVN